MGNLRISNDAAGGKFGGSVLEFFEESFVTTAIVC